MRQTGENMKESERTGFLAEKEEPCPLSVAKPKRYLDGYEGHLALRKISEAGFYADTKAVYSQTGR